MRSPRDTALRVGDLPRDPQEAIHVASRMAVKRGDAKESLIYSGATRLP